ncbi:MAG TPA: ATP-binding cassette domain-containing protein [Geminicoccaceae bacterium]|nr:ATP-binding cassette domain-containing protein [Geminicoccaceae bacterium]
MSLLAVEGLEKRYRRGLLRRRVTFSLAADFRIAEPAVVGVMGPNGSGKTTLFELITGSNRPSAGRVLCCGKDIHRVRADERDRLAIHYHQAYQVRRFARRLPNFMLERAGSDYPMVHLFDEPQFSTQDGYIGFMLDFFRRLRREDRLVFLCLHPNERYHLEILREVCERYLFVFQGRVSQAPDFTALLRDDRVRAYLGDLAIGWH